MLRRILLIGLILCLLTGCAAPAGEEKPTIYEASFLTLFDTVTVIKGAADSNRIDWYCEDQLICSTEPSAAHTHMSIGSSTNGAHVAVVEYVKIYPTV